MIDLTFPYRAIVEQAIAKFEIPPFMFGLYQWDSRQTMSGDQRDVLTSKIEGMRRMEQPVIKSSVDTILALMGYPTLKWELEWSAVGLRDETEEARAKHLDASANEKIVNYTLNMVAAEFMSPSDAVEYLQESGIIMGKSYGPAWEDRIFKTIVEAKKKNALKNIAKEILN